MGWRSPLTVSGFVIPIAVETVNRHPFGTFSHIGKEISEDMPTFADFNSLAAVVLPTVIGEPVATFHHCAPTYESRGDRSDARVSMLDIEEGGAFAARATTTRRRATSQFVSADERLDAAIAGADPLGVSVFANVRESDDDKSTVSGSADIFESRHDGSFRERLRLGADPSSDEWIRSAYYTTEASRGRAEA